MEASTTYSIEYMYQSCFDDGGLGHDITDHTAEVKIEADSDESAQIISLGEGGWRRPKHCYDQAYGPSPTRIVKRIHEETEDGFTRDTTEYVPLPRNRQCPCGNRYWPIRGEKACHELVEVGPNGET